MKKHNSILDQEEVNFKNYFNIIGKYKWSIIFLTLIITALVTIKIYLMPKYYKSTVTIEVKESEKGQAFSIGGAALLSMVGGSSSSLEKDISLLKTYRTNEKVLDKVKNYMVRYFKYDVKKYQSIEMDQNISIQALNIKIKSFQYYGLRLKLTPLNKSSYQLSYPGKFKDDIIGTFKYNETIQTEKISLKIVKKQEFTHPYIIQFSGTKRYVFNHIVSKNLTITKDKSAPFLIISYFDTLPKRGEAYLKNLIETYTKESIHDLKSDADIQINSYNKQLKHIEKKVSRSANKLEKYKIDNQIIKPDLQAKALVTELTKVDINIANSIYKEELLQTLIDFVQTNQNIDAIAPSLMELGDKSTINLINMIQAQQIKISNLLIKYKPNHPDIIHAQTLEDALQNKVLSNLDNLRTTFYNRTMSLKKMKTNYNQKLQSAPTQEQKLITFSRDYRINEKLYIYLMQERSAAELKRDKALSRFKIIESIYTANDPAKPNKKLLVIVTFISVLILTIFLAFFREFIRKGK